MCISHEARGGPVILDHPLLGLAKVQVASSIALKPIIDILTHVSYHKFCIRKYTFIRIMSRLVFLI